MVAYNDVNIASVVQYAVEHLHVEDIVVCGHYQCGGVAAACSDNLPDGYIADWLMITSWAKRTVDERTNVVVQPWPDSSLQGFIAVPLRRRLAAAQLASSRVRVHELRVCANCCRSRVRRCGPCSDCSRGARPRLRSGVPPSHLEKRSAAARG